MFDLQSERIRVIEPGSDISTYSLIDNADVVLTFGSTVGVEATYWGRPSICIGPSRYEGLDATFNATSHAEAVTLLGTVRQPKPELGSLMYGYYYGSFGESFEHYSPDSGDRGSLNGIPLSGRPSLGHPLGRAVRALAVRNPGSGRRTYNALRQAIGSSRPFNRRR